VSFQTWLEKTHYTATKKEQLRRLHARTLLLGNDDFNRYETFCKCFNKNEPYPTWKNPRGIFARKDEFKLRVGPIFKLIEEALFVMRFFIKKVPVNQRAHLIRKLFGLLPGYTDKCAEELLRFMATDFTAFESSFTNEFMEACEFQLYEYMVSELPEGARFMKLLRTVLGGENYCVFAGIIIRLLAGRMSGEMNTSLGNGFSNLMMFLFAVEEFDLRNAKCLIEGDDCIASYIGVMIPKAFYAQLGFNIKTEYLVSPNLASFCGQIFDFETLTVIADPIKVILNISWCHILYARSSERKLHGLLKNRAQSCIYQYPGCPIIQSLGLYLLRATGGVHSVVEAGLDSYKRFIAQCAARSNLPIREVSVSSRLLMNEVYGISVPEQLSLEKYFDGLKCVQPLSHPVIYAHCKNEWFEFDEQYVIDRFGSYVVLPNIRGALSKSLLNLLNVIKTQNEK